MPPAQPQLPPPRQGAAAPPAQPLSLPRCPQHSTRQLPRSSTSLPSAWLAELPDSRPSSPEPASAALQLPAPLAPSTHQVPLLRELGVRGLHEHVSLGPALCHLLLQPLHLGAERPWGSRTRLGHSCRASSPQALASWLPGGAAPRHITASDPARATAASDCSSWPPLPAEPGGIAMCPVTGYAPAEQAGQGTEPCRAACSASATTRHAPCQCTESSAGAGDHGRAATPPRWDPALPCTPCPCARTERSKGCPTPWGHSPQDGDTGSAKPCPSWLRAGLPPGSATGPGARGWFQAAQHWLTGHVRLPGAQLDPTGPPSTYLRLPGQTAVPGLVGREGTLHHAAVPEVVIVTKDLQQSKEQDRQESPISPVPHPPTCKPELGLPQAG